MCISGLWCSAGCFWVGGFGCACPFRDGGWVWLCVFEIVGAICNYYFIIGLYQARGLDVHSQVHSLAAGSYCTDNDFFSIGQFDVPSIVAERAHSVSTEGLSDAVDDYLLSWSSIHEGHIVCCLCGAHRRGWYGLADSGVCGDDLAWLDGFGCEKSSVLHVFREPVCVTKKEVHAFCVRCVESESPVWFVSPHDLFEARYARAKPGDGA
jgi:hypothetical protein